MPTRRITLEEDDNQGGMPPPSAPDADFAPQEHPWEYSEQARVLISDKILTPGEEQLKEFTFMPQGIVFEMVLGDTMTAMMDNYTVKGFNLAKYLLRTVDQRLRGLDGKMVKYAVLLAGDEQKSDEINPMSGPTL
jgi:hypothetical protein